MLMPNGSTKLIVCKASLSMVPVRRVFSDQHLWPYGYGTSNVAAVQAMQDSDKCLYRCAGS